MAVRFEDYLLPLPADKECAICQDIGDERTYVMHQNGGNEHPLHFECVKQWLLLNQTCPVCRVPISNDLSTIGDRIKILAKEAGNNARIGAESAEGPLIFGAATAALIAAVELSGVRGAKDILAIAGANFGIAALYFGAMLGTKGSLDNLGKKAFSYALAGAGAGASIGAGLWAKGFTPNFSLVEVIGGFGLFTGSLSALASPFVGRGNRSAAGSEERASLGKFVHFSGTAVGVLAWFAGKTQDSQLAQVFGIAAIAKSTGLAPLAFGAGVGTMIGAFQKYFGSYAKEAVSTLSAASTAVVLHTRNNAHLAVTGVSTRFGYSGGTIAFNYFKHLVGKDYSLLMLGAASGIVAAVGSTLLSRAHRAYRARALRHDN